MDLEKVESKLHSLRGLQVLLVCALAVCSTQIEQDTGFLEVDGGAGNCPTPEKKRKKEKLSSKILWAKAAFNNLTFLLVEGMEPRELQLDLSNINHTSIRAWPKTKHQTSTQIIKGNTHRLVTNGKLGPKELQLRKVPSEKRRRKKRKGCLKNTFGRRIN